MMNYETMNELLEQHMTEKGLAFWKAINSKIPPVWDKPVSSTGKYHNKKGGYVPTLAEHTYEMIYSATKIYAMFGINKETVECDLLLIGVAIHDIVKYGNNNDRKFCDNAHDRLIANRIQEKRDIFIRHFSEEQVDILIEMVRYHQGKWSADAKGTDFDFKNFHPYTLFLHTLDMLSSRNCLKIE